MQRGEFMSWETISLFTSCIVIIVPIISFFLLKWAKEKSTQYRTKLQMILFILLILMILAWVLNEFAMSALRINIRIDLFFTVPCILIQVVIIINEYVELKRQRNTRN